MFWLGIRHGPGSAAFRAVWGLGLRDWVQDPLPSEE